MTAAAVIAGMTISLDGYVADSSGSADRLYTDLDDLRKSPYMQTLIEETGAVVMGRKAFEMGDPDSYVGNYEFQVPIFVLTHHPPSVPPKQDERLTFTFVADGVASAIEQAKAAAGDQNVHVVGGASVVRELLRGGMLDELRIEVVPVVLGRGVPLFGGFEPEGIRLEKIGVEEFGPRTRLRFRVLKET
jgi:dihydrofolate reductase